MSFLLLVLISLLSGFFHQVVLFTSIIFVHEMGHVLMALIFKWDVSKISFYAYGGESVFNEGFNKPLIEEALIMISGPFIQLIFVFILKMFLPFRYIYLVNSYNYSILFFNLLPVYPLDGGRLVGIIFNYFFSYKKSFKYTIFFSYFIIWLIMFIFFYFSINISLNIVLMFIFLIFKLKKEVILFPYVYNRFLLERVLYPVRYKKLRIVNSYDDLYKDSRHLIRVNNYYVKEGYFLK